MSKPSATPDHPDAARGKEAPPAGHQDYLLKLGSARALSATGHYVRLDVALSAPPVSAAWKGKLTDITDVDVLGASYDIDFHMNLVCITCKSGKSTSLSPIRECFTLAGVMKYLGATRGHAVFAAKKVEPHMATLAAQLDVGLMDHHEWSTWSQQLTDQSPFPVIFEDKIYLDVRDRLSKWSEIRDLLAYLRNDFWFYRDFRNVQISIAMLKRVKNHLRDSPLSHFIFRDASAMFSLALMDLCRFIRQTGVKRLNDALPPYLFGGTATYRSRQDLLTKVEELLRRHGVLEKTLSLPALDPPYLKSLLELTLRLVSKPQFASQIPCYLMWRASESAGDVVGVSQSRVPTFHPVVEKLALDALHFVSDAADLTPALKNVALIT